MKRWATRLHAWVYRRSGGRVLGRIGGQPVLLLQTTGRRSGRTRTTPLQYVAHAAGGDERMELWRQLSAANRHLPGVQTKAGRQLPLLVLTPTKRPRSGPTLTSYGGATGPA
jgi:F420H(2)-dependent quinone reductase